MHDGLLPWAASCGRQLEYCSASLYRAARVFDAHSITALARGAINIARAVKDQPAVRICAIKSHACKPVQKLSCPASAGRGRQLEHRPASIAACAAVSASLGHAVEI